MADIADIGFRADTSDLDKAVLTLNKLRTASKGVTTSTTSVTRAVEGSGRSLNKVALEVASAKAKVAKANLDMVLASKKATKAEADQARQSLKLARAEESKSRAIIASAKANMSLERASRAATVAQSKQLTIMDRINRTTGASRVTKSARDSATVFGGIANDQMPNRFNTANIAAQFQDVGVTAAMGMNPLTIALQQGTQLSAILNSMESPLQGLKVAFASIINPVSLMTIGFIAAVAAGIQFVDWADATKSALMGLADIIEDFGPALVGLVGALSLVYAPAILMGIKTLIVTIWSLGSAAVVAGVKMAATWVMAMGPIGWIIAGITTLLFAINGFKEELSGMMGFDVLEPIKKGTNTALGYFFGLFSGIWEGVKELWAKLKGESTRSLGEAFQAGMSDALAKDYIAGIGDVSAKIANKVRNFSAGIAGTDEKKKKGGKTDAEKYDDIINSTTRRIEVLKAEQAALGMTELAASKLRIETDLLNDAKQKNIELSPMQRAELGELADTMATMEHETKKAKEALDFARESGKSFFSDLRSGLKEGQTLWESFGNAVSKVLDKLMDKMLDASVDMMFEGLTKKDASTGSSIGGSFLSSIASGIGGFFGGGSTSVPVPVSKPTQFAKGGSFSNGLFDSPTAFAFANGGSFGVMGEAGPEAVMPLHRGSDGSLGVKVAGSQSGGKAVIVNVNNYSDNKATVQQRQGTNGLEIDVLIEGVVASSINKRGSKINRSLRQFNSSTTTGR